MRERNYIWFLLLTTAISLFTFEQAFNILHDQNLRMNPTVRFLINLPACILIGFVDFFLVRVIHKKLNVTNDLIRISIDLILTNFIVGLLSIIANYLLSWFYIYTYHIEIILPLLMWNSFVVFLIEIFFYIQRTVEAEKKVSLIEKEKLQYQLETLKSQINPHFLFNSLNVLSSLAYQDPGKTNLFAKKMSGVYRYLLLTNSQQTVTLKEEINFLESYIFLEMIRFKDALFVEIPDYTLYATNKIIPVSLQQLVENAIKHNITTTHTPLKITLSFASDGVFVKNIINLKSSVDKSGIGLKNIEKQYALYGERISIDFSETEFSVKIPFIRNQTSTD